MDYQNNPSKASMGWFLLAVVSAIPVVGYAAKPFKLAKITKLTKIVDKAESAVKTGNQGAKMRMYATRANVALSSLRKYRNIIIKHVVENIPINKATALKIIEKFPILRVANKPIYRGMRVDANYIKKNFGDDIFRTCCAGQRGTHVIEVNTTLKPKSKSGTSSWSLDASEGDIWARGWGAAPDKPYEILYVSGAKSSEGLNMSATATGLGDMSAKIGDWAEVAMIGAVDVEKVIIINRTKKGVRVDTPGRGYVGAKSAMDANLKAGFYPAGSRKEILTILGEPTSLKESIVKKQLIRVRVT